MSSSEGSQESTNQDTRLHLEQVISEGQFTQIALELMSGESSPRTRSAVGPAYVSIVYALDVLNDNPIIIREGGGLERSTDGSWISLTDLEFPGVNFHQDSILRDEDLKVKLALEYVSGGITGEGEKTPEIVSFKVTSLDRIVPKKVLPPIEERRDRRDELKQLELNSDELSQVIQQCMVSIPETINAQASRYRFTLGGIGRVIFVEHIKEESLLNTLSKIFDSLPNFRFDFKIGHLIRLKKGTGWPGTLSYNDSREFQSGGKPVLELSFDTEKLLLTEQRDANVSHFTTAGLQIASALAIEVKDLRVYFTCIGKVESGGKTYNVYSFETRNPLKEDEKAIVRVFQEAKKVLKKLAGKALGNGSGNPGEAGIPAPVPKAYYRT